MGTTDDFCYACGNLGFPDKKCPLCGREPTRKSMNFEYQDNSDFVKKITGAYSVSEAAAKLLGGKIILTKKIIDSITFSITEEI